MNAYWEQWDDEDLRPPPRELESNAILELEEIDDSNYDDHKDQENVEWPHIESMSDYGLSWKDFL